MKRFLFLSSRGFPLACIHHYDYYYYGIITVTNIFEITNSIIHNITISIGSMWLLFIQLNIIMS